MQEYRLYKIGILVTYNIHGMKIIKLLNHIATKTVKFCLTLKMACAVYFFFFQNRYYNLLATNLLLKQMPLVTTAR